MHDSEHSTQPPGGEGGARRDEDPGASASKGTRGLLGGGWERKQAIADKNNNDDDGGDDDDDDADDVIRGMLSQADDPMVFGEDMIGEKIWHNEIRKAQQADEFARMMIERCERAGAAKGKRASEFMVIEGALFRVTSSGDPQEGRESQRVYVPAELRAALMRNYHSTVW